MEGGGSARVHARSCDETRRSIGDWTPGWSGSVFGGMGKFGPFRWQSFWRRLEHPG